MRQNAQRERHTAARQKRIEEAVYFLREILKSAPNRIATRELKLAILRCNGMDRNWVNRHSRESIQRSSQKAIEKNRLSALRARNSRAEWTTKESELVMNTVLPDAEIARAIGRSIKAVRMQRVRLSRRPVSVLR